MNAVQGFLTALWMFFAAQTVLAQNTDTHCKGDEAVIFSCPLGRKLVSVCAAPDNSFLYYRFGGKNNIELALAHHKNTPGVAVQGDTLTFAGGGGAYLRFLNQGYSYVMYTAIGRGWGSKAGIVVEKNGLKQAHLACSEEAISELGPDWFTRAGIAANSGNFELP